MAAFSPRTVFRRAHFIPLLNRAPRHERKKMQYCLKPDAVIQENVVTVNAVVSRMADSHGITPSVPFDTWRASIPPASGAHEARMIRRTWRLDLG